MASGGHGQVSGIGVKASGTPVNQKLVLWSGPSSVPLRRAQGGRHPCPGAGGKAEGLLSGDTGIHTSDCVCQCPRRVRARGPSPAPARSTDAFHTAERSHWWRPWACGT